MEHSAVFSESFRVPISIFIGWVGDQGAPAAVAGLQRGEAYKTQKTHLVKWVLDEIRILLPTQHLPELFSG